MTYTQNDIQRAIEDIIFSGIKLTEWEYNFLESIEDNLSLTPKQQDCLSNIWLKASKFREG